MNAKKLYFSPHTDRLHAWVPTASPLIERCGRGSCKVMRNSRNGEWIEVKPARRRRTNVEAQQPGLWA